MGKTKTGGKGSRKHVRGKTTAERYFKSKGLTSHHNYIRKTFALK